MTHEVFESANEGIENFDQDVDVRETFEVYENHGETQLSYNSAEMAAAVQLDDRICLYSDEEMRGVELEEWWGIPASLAGLFNFRSHSCSYTRSLDCVYAKSWWDRASC